MAGSRIPRIEMIIISVFFLGVAVWAVDRCTSRRVEVVKRIQEFAAEDEPEERANRTETELPKPSNPVPAPQSQAAQPQPEPAAAAPGNMPPMPGKKSAKANSPVAPAPASPGKTAAKPPATTADGTTLFVTIDGLKMRKEPGLKGETVAKLKLYEPVTFLNKKTEWTQEISLGYEKVTDHWVKVRTKSGKEGWVFGAGVHFYKMKRKGTF